MALAVEIPSIHCCPAKVGAGMPVWGAAVVAALRCSRAFWSLGPNTFPCEPDPRQAKPRRSSGEHPEPTEFLPCPRHCSGQPVHARNHYFGVSKTLVSWTIHHFPDSCMAAHLPSLCTRCQITSGMFCTLLQRVMAQGKSNLPHSHRSCPCQVFAPGSSVSYSPDPFEGLRPVTEDAGLGSLGAYGWWVHGTPFSTEIGASLARSLKQEFRFPQFISWLFIMAVTEPWEQQ